MKASKILWLENTSVKDVSLVGGKNASLGEMIVHLTSRGINVPGGFATTAQAYFSFLQETATGPKIKEILADLDVSDIKNLQVKGKAIRSLILNSSLGIELEQEIISAYEQLSQRYGVANLDVAVRSSATAEDLPGASFAGQQDTFLNISGKDNLLVAVKKCFASLFTDRAIVYRQEMGFDHLQVGLSAGVQKMVRADLGSSGVMFSCDTESGFGDVVLINASYGLGENIVQGKVEPDQYYVFETTLKKGFSPIIEKRIGKKMIKMIYATGSKPVKNISVSPTERNRFVLADGEILTLAKWAITIEEHYQKSMDMEWAKDGKDGKLYIVQARPETVQSKKDVRVIENYSLDMSSPRKILVSGLSVGSKIGQGTVKRILSVNNIRQFKRGDVLVTDMTDPDWVPAMKLASAIVTDSGGRTAHAAIVSRELGIPCVVGTGNATRIIKNGKKVTVSCAQGEKGVVYEGLIPFEVKKTDVSNLEATETKILMNVGDPGSAFKLSFIPNDGVGLAREEFIIANDVQVHPLALVHYSTLKPSVRKQIDRLTVGYRDKKEFFVDKLAHGIGKIAAAFYPKPVIVRLSDFKTNEYRSLLGGEFFEPNEENPMIGWRGASRYYDPQFAPAFVLECQALKMVREKFGLTNVMIMVPFCRTPEEGKKVVDLMNRNGLQSGKEGLKIYVMCEIPANVVLAREFLEIFDGFSIGSNDLAQLILGLDRDNGKISSIANENNQAVKKMISNVIGVAKKMKKYSGICGQAPSDFPDFTEFLITEGIESISLNPDSVMKTRIQVAAIEKKRKSLVLGS